MKTKQALLEPDFTNGRRARQRRALQMVVSCLDVPRLSQMSSLGHLCSGGRDNHSNGLVPSCHGGVEMGAMCTEAT